MRILVKVGGAQLEAPAARASLVRAIARARMDRHEIVLVHGGGNQIRELSRRLGLAERYHAGLRITDAATADVVLMVLAGLVNKTLVAACEAGGVRACGLCGADGASFGARPLTQPDVDLGYVGLVARIDPQLVETLLDAGYLPVIATSAPVESTEPGAPRRCASTRAVRAMAQGESRTRVLDSALAEGAHFYNINADHAAGPLARELEVDALLFLTDVPGVLDAEGTLIATLSPAQVAELCASGVIEGGMIPKVEAALAALAASPQSIVKIAPAAGDDAIRAALDAGSGTCFERGV